jgi:hypothetical protein
VSRFLRQAVGEDGADLESLEFALRKTVLMVGASLLEEMLEGLGSGRQDEAISCSCGCRMKSRGRKKKRIKTILGDIRFMFKGHPKK